MDREATIEKLKRSYELKRGAIESRFREFEETYRKGDRAIFEELVFCIFTAGASARMGLASVEAIRDVLMAATGEELTGRLEGVHRYPEARANYIVHTRSYLRDELDFRIKEKIESFSDRKTLREFFADNKGIKGIGYKEASHFLRNIGFRGYAILDIHILRSLYEFGLMDRMIRTAKKSEYLDIESLMKDFASEIGIDFDHLDMLLWSEKTGKILK